jgi:putative redox protein
MASNTARATVRWRHQLVFEGSGPGRPPLTIDGDSAAGLSPVELLLVACASCTGADIVGILEKTRVRLEVLDIEVVGTRREDHPRRFTAIQFRVSVRGAGADETKVRRAVDLSLEKYCSVMASLAPDIRVDCDVAIA